MMMAPAGVRVHLALGVTDMRKGIDGLAMLVQGTLKQDPFCGHLFAFRGRKANLVKILFWDGTGLCLFTKRLERLADDTLIPVLVPWGGRTASGLCSRSAFLVRHGAALRSQI